MIQQFVIQKEVVQQLIIVFVMQICLVQAVQFKVVMEICNKKIAICQMFVQKIGYIVSELIHVLVI
jgi:hypothetical protein